MPPKKKAAAKKGKAAAKPAYLTDEEHCAPFGLFANDIVTTPLGISCTVLGVKSVSYTHLTLPTICSV